MKNSLDFDVTIVGAGVVGLSCAYQLSLQKKNLKILLIDKEASHGMHISSRSSEQIHAGIYYKNDSLKAKLCLEGKNLLYQFLNRYDVPHSQCGKIFLAFNDDDIKKLEQTHKQANDNGLQDLYFLNKAQLKKIEPDISAHYALKSPTSGIFDTHKYMYTLLYLSENNGVTFAKKSKLEHANFENNYWSLTINTDDHVTTRYIVNAAGLDSIALGKSLTPLKSFPTLYPSKGCFVKFNRPSPIKHIIYPAITPGAITERVDATPDLQGRLKFGPTLDPVNFHQDYEFPDNLIERMLPSIKKYLPKVETNDLSLDYCGIRPRIYNQGAPLDFIFDSAIEKNCLHLLGMESPALTSSLAIGLHFCSVLEKDFLG